MATTARKTTAARKTAAAKTTKTEPVEEPKAEETKAEAPASAEAPAEAPAPAPSAPVDEGVAESPASEGDPTSDEADAPVAEETEETADPAGEPVVEAGLTDAEKATNAAEIAGRHAIAESGNVPGVATTPIRVDSVDLEHAPLDAPKPKAEEKPALPAEAESQFADVAVVHLQARPEADVIDEATGKAPVAPLFSEPVFGLVTSNYRLLETGVANGRVVKRLLVAQHTQLSTHAAAKIEAYVAELNADVVED